jgi:dihydrofolate reductase
MSFLGTVATQPAAVIGEMLMSDTTCQMSISLDGFVAGPEHSRDNPLGKRGREPHGWHTGDPRATGADKTANGWLMRPRGAYVMGRNMFGRFAVSGMRRGTDGGDPSPPYHAPGLRAHSPHLRTDREGGRDHLQLVTEGFDAAYARALETAGGKGVDIAGGASTIRQALNVGVIDELTLDIAPVLLGTGERMFDGVETFDFEPVEVLHSPLTIHVRYRRRNAG